MGRFLTPDDSGGGDFVSLLLFIPDTPEWRAIFRGLLLLLLDSGNWESFGALSPAECVELLDPFISDAIASF